MKNIISKELLSKLLGEDCRGIISIRNELQGEFDPCLLVEYLSEGGKANLLINVHELAHKCKEWAMQKHNLWCISYRTKIGATCKTFDTRSKNSKMFISSSEPEAIFKACQWILDSE